MKKSFLFVILLFLFMLVGCGTKYQLVDNPIEFNTKEFVNPNNEDDGYLVIDYNGRTYVPYGTLKGVMKKDDVGDCIGYIVQDGVKIEDMIICLLVSDVENNYLIEIDTVGFMSQPIFFRAMDTEGQNIFMPKFIGSLEYDFRK